MATRILLADDHKIMRDGLRVLLDKESGMDVIGEAETGQQAVRLVDELNPDVIVMDIGMPDLNGIEATRHITSGNQAVRILALSMHSDRRYVTEMLRAGACGYLLKDSAFNELALAIRTVMSGRTYLSPDIAGVVVDECRKPAGSQGESPFSILTEREREVLQQLAEGNTTKEIAGKLFVSVKTIETHRSHIMEKLNLHSVAELTKYAIREGITSLEE
jgi:DNA-binding NarL/FixJ family response regulator